MTPLSYDEARPVLNAAGRDLKVALVMASAGLEPEAARERLAAADGRVAAAIGLATAD